MACTIKTRTFRHKLDRLSSCRQDYWDSHLSFQGVEFSREFEPQTHTFVEGDQLDARWTLIDGNHPLHYAAAFDNLLAAQRWIVSGTPVDIRNEHQKTPLYDAMSDYGKFKVFEFLIASGADVNVVDLKGRTPLHHAATSESPFLAGILIAAGANPTLRDAEDCTPAQVASLHGNSWTARVIKAFERRYLAT